jgi:alpha-ketoglutarate-dependent 2,4-dichlorophenoxyacetate dioxygenase
LTARANQLWHTDSSFKSTPALASVLSARIVPSYGGETEFTSTRQAWSRLPPAAQARLRDAIVTHAYANSRDRIDRGLMTPAERATMHRGHPWPDDQARSMVRTTISAIDADGLTELRVAA